MSSLIESVQKILRLEGIFGVEIAFIIGIWWYSTAMKLPIDIPVVLSWIKFVISVLIFLAVTFYALPKRGKPSYIE